MSNLIITEIVIKKRGIYKVKTDEDAFLITENQMIDYHVYKGATVSEELVFKIKTEFEQDVCYEAAMRFLSRRDHFKNELKNKLKLKQFSTDAIDSAIEKLSDEKIIDESSFANRLAKERLVRDSIVKTKQYLLNKGCPPNLADVAVIQDGYNEREKAYQTLLKKVKGLQDFNSEQVKNKLYRHLLGKGFSYADTKWAYQKLIS